MRTLRPKHGFTVVELLVSSAFVAVALVAAAATILESSELQRTNAQTRAAAPILASLIEEVRATPFDSLKSTWHNATRQVTGMPDCPTTTTARWEATDAAGADSRWSVVQVKVRLTWNGPRGTQTLSAVTYVSDRSGGSPPPGGIITRNADLP